MAQLSFLVNLSEDIDEEDEVYFTLRVEVDSEETDVFLCQHGLDGTGYSVETIISALIEEHLPSQSDEIDLNPEADNLLVHSPDKATLAQLQDLFCKLTADEGAFGAFCDRLPEG